MAGTDTRTRARPGARGGAPLAGLRVLVLEDEPLIALDIADTLGDAGAAVIGPYDSIEAALDQKPDTSISAAVLDLRIGGASVAPVARWLAERGVPFVFYSGQALPAEFGKAWPDAPLLAKPVAARTLVAAVARSVTPDARSR